MRSHTIKLVPLSFFLSFERETVELKGNDKTTQRVFFREEFFLQHHKKLLILFAPKCPRVFCHFPEMPMFDSGGPYNMAHVADGSIT
mgnify:CR=1 FL=1